MRARGAVGTSIKLEVLVSGLMMDASLCSDSSFLLIMHFLIQRINRSARMQKLSISKIVSTLTNDCELLEIFRIPRFTFSSELPLFAIGDAAFEPHMPKSSLITLKMIVSPLIVINPH